MFGNSLVVVVDEEVAVEAFDDLNAAAGFAMRSTGMAWIDPAVALVIAGVIAFGTWGLFRESLRLAMDAVPGQIAPAEVASFLRAVPGVQSVHDLHVWAMSTSETALTAHLVVPEREIRDEDLARISGELQHRFGIGHAAIQVERRECGAECDGRGEV